MSQGPLHLRQAHLLAGSQKKQRRKSAAVCSLDRPRNRREGRTQQRKKSRKTRGRSCCGSQTRAPERGCVLLSMPRSQTPAMALNKHIGTIRMMASGRLQLSYCAARVRNTRTTRSGKMKAMVLPAKISWNVKSDTLLPLASLLGPRSAGQECPVNPQTGMSAPRNGSWRTSTTLMPRIATMNPPLTPPRRGTDTEWTNACSPPGRGRVWVGSWRIHVFSCRPCRFGGRVGNRFGEPGVGGNLGHARIDRIGGQVRQVQHSDPAAAQPHVDCGLG